MTALRERSQRYYLALSEADEDALDTAASSALPPIVDCVVLDDYLGQQITEIREKLHDIRSYVWFAEAKYDEAEKHCLAAVSALKNGPQYAIKFFVDAVADAYHFDRALRASVVHKLPRPVHQDDIPKGILVVGPSGQQQGYHLRRRTFDWSTTVPSEAALKAAEVMCANPPDAFWIAEYLMQISTEDPIIYASYGSWQVEVARWE